VASFAELVFANLCGKIFDDKFPRGYTGYGDRAFDNRKYDLKGEA
jgi:hypothetical protein